MARRRIVLERQFTDFVCRLFTSSARAVSTAALNTPKAPVSICDRDCKI